MNDPVMFVIGLLAAAVIVLMLIDNDPKMDATPVEMYTVIPDVFSPREAVLIAELAEVIPDPFAPEVHIPGKHEDSDRAYDQPYVAMRFFDPANYGERTLAKVQRQADAFEFVQNWKG